MAHDLFPDSPIYQSPETPSEFPVASTSKLDDLVLARQLERAQETIAGLLPISFITLTTEEQEKVRIHQQASLILGAVAAAPMICKGAQCPFAETCPLFVINKHPSNEQCPFESNYVAERFMAWMMELGRTLETLLESERSVISNLVYIDLQERRMLQNLAKAENALMQSRSVRDVNVETGEPVCWEDVVAISKQNLSSLTIERRMLMKDFELTPEQKTKRQKALGIRKNNDLAQRQSDSFSRLQKKKQRPLTIDAATPKP